MTWRAWLELYDHEDDGGATLVIDGIFGSTRAEIAGALHVLAERVLDGEVIKGDTYDG